MNSLPFDPPWLAFNTWTGGVGWVGAGQGPQKPWGQLRSEAENKGQSHGKSCVVLKGCWFPVAQCEQRAFVCVQREKSSA